MSPKKILIVEDMSILLDGLVQAIDSDPDFEVAGKIRDASQVLDFLSSHPIDLLLTDIRTDNGENALNYLGEIHQAHPDMKIVVMTGVPELSYQERAKSLGADSFVYKNISNEELLTTLHRTLQGEQAFSKGPCDDFLTTLTKTEMMVLRKFCEGYDRKEIAQMLNLSENTIKFHIKSILEKTDYPSMARLAIYVVSNNYIVVDD